MTATIVEWLPNDALLAPPALAALDRCVAAWSHRWFGERTLQLVPNTTVSAPVSGAPTARHAWQAMGDGIWFDWDETAAHALALYALDQSVVPQPRTADDQKLLELLGQRIADDLVESVTERGPAGRGRYRLGHPGRSVAFHLANPANSFNLAVRIATHHLVRYRKGACPKAAQSAPASLSLATALADVAVDFDAALGTARMSLAELEALEPGDTVLLNRRLNQGIDVRAAATGKTVLVATLVRMDDQFSLNAN